MKDIFILSFLMFIVTGSNAQEAKQIGIGVNTTLHTNNTFRYKNSYVKGVPTIGYGFSLLYQQNLSNHFGFQTSLNYIRHHKTFQIDFPLKDFAEEYTSRPNYKFRYTIPRYRNLDLAIGLFYETNLSSRMILQLSTDITANYEVFWAKKIEHKTFYENPKPMVDSSSFFFITATHGISKRRRSLSDYMLLLTPQFRFGTTMNYQFNPNKKIYATINYERIVPFRNGEDGLFPVNFNFLNKDLIPIQRTDFMNKFNMLRFQIGFKYRINRDRD